MRFLIIILSGVALACSGVRAAAAGERAEAPPSGGVARASAAAAGGDAFVNLMAADFFESDLRLAQSRRIEADTASRYLGLDEAGRARFRAERKRLWREMSDAERDALRGAKRPRFDNLDEAQKETFRRIAAQELGAAGAGRDDI